MAGPQGSPRHGRRKGKGAQIINNGEGWSGKSTYFRASPMGRREQTQYPYFFFFWKQMKRHFSVEDGIQNPEPLVAWYNIQILKWS